MRDNRFSMAVSKSSNTNNQRNNSNIHQSNIKQSNSISTNLSHQNNIDSKSRKSSAQMLFPRSTTFSSLTKSSDPRPIKENHFQEECISKILDFLIKEQYDKSLAKKDLLSPQAKDFQNLFTWMLSKIRPDWNISITKLDEDVPPILMELRYPGYITKNHLMAVGAPNTWPHLLALLAWLVELAQYLNFDQIKEDNETQTYLNSLKIDPNDPKALDPVLQEKIFDHNYKEFLYEGYKQSLLKGDSFQAIENFQKKTDELINLNYSSADKLNNESSNLEKLTEELEKNYPTLNETKLKVEILSRDLNNTKNNFNLQEKKFNELSILHENRVKVYESKCEKNKELISIIEELDFTVKNQKISYEDFEKLKHNKNNLEKQLVTLNNKKNELNDSIWNLNNQIEVNNNSLNEKIKTINQICEKLMLEKENIIDLSEIINYNSNCNNLNSLNSLNNLNNSNSTQDKSILNLDMNEISQRFYNVNNFLISSINTKTMEVKEREEFLINLKSELLKLDDKINEVNEILAQKNAEKDRENNLLNIEKEKFNIF